MFAFSSTEDDAAVERLMADGYQYHEALLHVFSYRHPPRAPQHQQVQQPSPHGVYQYQPQQSMYIQQPQYAPAPAPYPVPMQQGQSFYAPNTSYYQQPQPVHAQSFYQPQPYAQDPYASQQYPAPAAATATATSSTNGLTRKASSASNGSGTASGSGAGSKPPVLNGGQTSLLQQQRNQDAWVAQNQPVEKKASSSSLGRKGSFLGGIGGITRKSAHNEDDLLNRATHLEQDPENKGRHVPKLKYKEADVQKIVKMGFTRDQAVQALVENHHNVDEAVHMLTDR